MSLFSILIEILYSMDNKTYEFICCEKSFIFLTLSCGATRVRACIFVVILRSDFMSVVSPVTKHSSGSR